jgi:predicted dienelactone hydrolase
MSDVRCLSFTLAVAVTLISAACREDNPLRPPTRLQADLLADAGPQFIGPYKVGHSTMTVVLTGSSGERRPLDVHLWYPADVGSHAAASATVYRSRLFGVPLILGTYDALSFEVPSSVAREDASIDQGGPRFPLLIWSHGAGGDAINYAFQEEAIASHGYVVVGLQHTGNGGDDFLVDAVNQAAGHTVLACLDNLPGPCAGDSFAKNIRDRVLDVSALITEFASNAHFGDRVDLERIGLIGQSRGAVTTIAAIAGSSTLGIAREPRVRAAFTMALGADAYSPSDFAGVSVPVVMMAGGSDEGTPAPVVRQLFDKLSNASRMFVVAANAEHRSFNSAYCAIMQAAGGIRVGNTRAILEEETVRRLAAIQSLGSTLDYCRYNFFVQPTDIRPLVQSITGISVTEALVPRTTDADQVTTLSSLLAVAFFDAALDQHGSDGLRFTRFLTPKYLTKHEPIVESAETVVVEGASCPEGQGCTGE